MVRTPRFQCGNAGSIPARAANMRILAIETSCDETSIAVLQTKEDGDFSILSNIVSSQVAIHAPFGGVVPTLAKREHQKNLTLILKQGLAEAKLLKVQSSKFPPASQARALRAGKVQSFFIGRQEWRGGKISGTMVRCSRFFRRH